MNIVKREKKLCLSCMEEHMVDTVEIEECSQFNGENIKYLARYEYCNETKEATEPEYLIRYNMLALKDAYRAKTGLLTSAQIRSIREMYGVTQKDLARILGWGQATVARYETVQVQDQAHDEILRKIIRDPKWYLEFLYKAEHSLSPEVYGKYTQAANRIMMSMRDEYLKSYIEIRHAGLDSSLTGNQELRIDKAVELINLIVKEASGVYKLKLVRLLWYVDLLNYKRYGRSITGMAYRTLPAGAAPIAYEQLFGLSGILYEEVASQDDIACYFRYNPAVKDDLLSEEEKKTAVEVCRRLGDMKTVDLMKKTHKEKLCGEVGREHFISYEYAKDILLE